jgi:Uma2 family endonuclease
MSNPATKLKTTFAEYIAGENASDRKHQLVDGEVFDMGGGTPTHAALILAVGAELRALLRGKPCKPFASELRVRAAGIATYPDCVVVCGPLQTDPEDANTVLNPTLLVEVLSDSTEAFDRGRKAEHYRRIPSLREYVLVSQHEPHIEVVRRTERGWILLEAGAGGTLQLESVGCSLVVDAIYEGVIAAPAQAG